MKKPYVKNIDKDTMDNEDYRIVVFTGNHFQLVLMNILPGEDIGGEVHPDTDQFFRIESGSGKAIINDQEYEISEDYGIVIPAGTNHNIINTGTEPLKLYSLYAPPEHKPGKVEPTKVSESTLITSFSEFINENFKNTHKIVLTFNNQRLLDRFKSTPTFSKTVAPNQMNSLTVGDNEIFVNNVALNGLERMSSMGLYLMNRLSELREGKNIKGP